MNESAKPARFTGIIDANTMNRIVTHLAEKWVELGYSILTFGTPNSFQVPDETSNAWYTSSPDDFYAVPDGVPDLQFRPLAEANGERLARFHFPSSFTSPHPQNNTVYGLADLHTAGEARAALIFLHGHMMTRATLFPLLWYARTAIRGGYDVYYMNLPYHMLRKPTGTYSGQHSLNANVEGSAMAFRQGVQDVRSLITWIDQERHLPVVLAGISLGAYTACMTAVVDERPRSVVSILGGASLARIPWDGYQGGKIRRQLRQGGVSLEQLEQWWALLNPGNWQPRIDPKRVLLIGGQYDEIVTPSNVHHLWRAWNKPKILWYPCGHVSSALYHRQISAELSRFVENNIF